MSNLSVTRAIAVSGALTPSATFFSVRSISAASTVYELVAASPYGSRLCHRQPVAGDCSAWLDGCHKTSPDRCIQVTREPEVLQIRVAQLADCRHARDYATTDADRSERRASAVANASDMNPDGDGTV